VFIFVALATIYMPYSSLYIHVMWSTKNREKTISTQLKTELLDFISSYCREKSIHIDRINCVSDHIHILLSLKADQSVASVLGLIKGASSYHINKNKLSPVKFEWQDDYLAFSVSLSVLNKVRLYVENQEAHHAKKTFSQEYSEFVKAYGFDKNGG
jgi:putative transposase